MTADTLTPPPARGTEQAPARSSRRPGRRSVVGREPAGVRWGLRVLAVAYVVLLVAWPTFLVFPTCPGPRPVRHDPVAAGS